MKRLACGDLVAGCQAVIENDGDDEIIAIAIAGKHAAEVHGMEVTPEFVAAVRGAIHDIEEAEIRA